MAREKNIGWFHNNELDEITRIVLIFLVITLFFSNTNLTGWCISLCALILVYPTTYLIEEIKNKNE